MDREKVIDGLTDLKRFLPSTMWESINDALALLKEQQEKIDRLLEESASNAEMAEGLKELLKKQEAVEPFHRCIGKEFSLIEDSYFDYCPYCGKPITWEGR